MRWIDDRGEREGRVTLLNMFIERREREGREREREREREIKK